MTKKLVWRLGKLPSPDELVNLINAKIITQEEAREILFNVETEEDRDKKSLESEIKFLRELVEKLSEGRTQIITTIREIERPYYRQPWYQPYTTWCANAGNTLTLKGADISDGTITTNPLAGSTNINWNTNGAVGASNNFSGIKTF